MEVPGEWRKAKEREEGDGFVWDVSFSPGE
jgi:hypothetical protein